MTGEWSFTFAADRLPEFHRLIDKANRRLERAGAPILFDPAISPAFDKLVSLGSGLNVAVPHVTVTLPSLRLSLGDYTFVAALVPEEAGWTVHSAPGESLDGWQRPSIDEWPACDHCKTQRKRVRVYVVREDSTGKLIQLGHNCIQLFTGLEPKGLWALSFDHELKEFSERDEFGSLGSGSRDFGIAIDTVLALSFAYSDGGRAYVSKAKADEWGKESTVERIRMHLFSPPKATSHPNDRGYREYQEYLDFCAKASEVSDELLAAIKASAETLRAGTDYADNMAIILAAESGYVSRRNVGVLASLVAVYRRGLEDAAKRAAQPAPATGFLGEVGDRLKNVEIVARTVKVWEGYYGMTTFLVGTTDSGHTVVWKASGQRNWEPGDRIKLTAATIKAQENYQGTDQTVVTRARVG